MNAETTDYLAKARAALADARRIATLPLAHIAAREAYLAVFHAAEAFIFERTGRIAKTHRGVRTEFARLARTEARITPELARFLTVAYEFKDQADYAVGPKLAAVSQADAEAAMAMAARFIDVLAEVLGAAPPAA